MSKWEDSFKKTNNHDDDGHNCQDNQVNGLVVPNRQLSIMVAGFLFLFFVIFIAGYFLGKRSACEQFMQQVRSDSDIDRTSSNGNIINDVDDQEISDEFIIDDAHEVALLSPDVITENSDEISIAQVTIDPQKKAQFYYAQLIGFGTEKAAQSFVQKLALKDIETVVNKHSNKTAKGRVVHWYQVVTVPYTNKDELSAVVAQLVKDEKLKDVSIRSC